MTKYIIRSLLLLPGTVVLANAMIATALSNLSAGIWMTYILGLVLLTGGIAFHRLPTWLIATGGVGLLIVFFCVAALFLYGSTDTVTYNEDAIIVLGAGVQGDKPTKSLQNRLDRTVAYHKQNPDALIVVSGSQGPQETVTEAYAMEQYLIKQGVPAALILKEEAATSTTENFRFSKILLDEQLDRSYSLAFLTTDYHIYRAAVNAERIGFHRATHCHSGTPWYMIVPNGLRECLAVCKLWFFQK